jgi:GTP diphosphokinase / guanosine-3',5'-bis(diphosphate) 3'-diphosphatase
MHDVVEDTDITVADVEREFGREIAQIVDGLTKIATCR